jgi:hypothetical protein
MVLRSPQQNGTMKRKNISILSMARRMLKTKKMPKCTLALLIRTKEREKLREFREKNLIKACISLNLLLILELLTLHCYVDFIPHLLYFQQGLFLFMIILRISVSSF